MPFDISEQARAERARPRWIAVTSDDQSVTLHVLLAPRDEAVVATLDARYPEQERLTPSGRIRERSREQREAWIRDYLVAHIRDWDVMDGAAQAAITADTVAYLPESLQILLLQRTRSEHLAAHEVACPFPSSPPTSNGGSTTPA